MIEYTDAGLVTDDPVVIETIKPHGPGTYRVNKRNWLYPWPAVWAAIQPVEGEGAIADHENYPGAVSFTVEIYAGEHAYHHTNMYHMHVLLLLKQPTRAELRELVGRCKDA